MVGIGSTVGNYRVVKKLGSGAMGAVYLAEHPQIGKRVALKVIHPDLADNAEMVSRFFNEARAVNQIGHEHIVTVLDFGQTPEGDNFIVMELLEGEALADRLKRESRFDIPTMIRITTQIAEGLAASHAHGIVHRDLKPDNIHLIERLGKRDYVKILDFGLAKLTQGGAALSHKTQAGSVLGTPHYMAPEQAEGKPDIDARADVYALGCLMYQMLTGRVPFPGEGFGEVLIKHLREPPVPPSRENPEVPPALEKIVLQALAKRKEFRFQSMTELMKALADPAAYARALGGEEPVQIAPAAPVVATRPASEPARAAPPVAAHPVVSVPPSAQTVEFDTVAEGSQLPPELAALQQQAPAAVAPVVVADEGAATVAEEMPAALREALLKAAAQAPPAASAATAAAAIRAEVHAEAPAEATDRAEPHIISTSGTAAALGAASSSMSAARAAAAGPLEGPASATLRPAPKKVAETARVPVIPRKRQDAPAARRAMPWWALAGGGTALVAIGAAVVLLLARRPPAPAVAPVVEAVAVTIESDPPEAEVFREERPLGTAPVIVKLLPGAVVGVTVRKEGYRDAERRIDASGAPKVVVTLEADPAAAAPAEEGEPAAAAPPAAQDKPPAAAAPAEAPKRPRTRSPRKESPGKAAPNGDLTVPAF